MLNVTCLLLGHPPVEVGQLQVADLMQVGDVESLVAHRVAVLGIDSAQEGEKDQEHGERAHIIAGHVIHAQHLEEGQHRCLVGRHQVTQPLRAHRPDPLLHYLPRRVTVG